MTTSIMNNKEKNEHKSIFYGTRIAAVLFWVFVWQFASMKIGQEILLASPVSVVQKLIELMQTADFWQAVGFSFGRIITGFFFALFIGICLAILSYRFALVQVLLSPLITVVKAVPVASFIILCLIWIPSRNLSVFISFLMVLPVVYTNILEGIRQTAKDLLEMADVFSLSMGRRVLYIYLSQVLPYLLSACTLGLGLCWKAGVAAEVIGVPSGSVGEMLYNAKVYLDTPDLFAWTIVIIVLSFVFEKCFLWILRYGVARAERR